MGLVRDVTPLVRGAEEPLPPYLFTATLSNFDFRKVDRQERVSAGKGRTEEEARHAAIGEAVERYCAQHWDPRRTRLATWDQVRDAAISPADCVLYSDEQYARAGWPFHRWDPAEQVTWLPAIELPARREIVVPASLAYLVTPVARTEDGFTNATSNGLAAGGTLTAAILGGLYEIIERDALLVTWMNRLPAVEIDLHDTLDAAPAGLAGSIVRHYACFGVDVRAFVMRTDAPATVVMAIAFDAHPQRPAALVGLGCHARPAIALEKALFEVCQMRPAELRRYQEHPPRDRVRRYEDVKTLADHSAFFSQPRHVHELEFLWSRGERARLADLPDGSIDRESESAGDPRDQSRDDSGGDPGGDRGDVPGGDLSVARAGSRDAELAGCVAALTARGHRVAYADVTTSDVAPLGLSVVRAFITGFQPVHFGDGNERLGGRRLFDLPHQLGLAPGPRTVADLNPCPHPLA